MGVSGGIYCLLKKKGIFGNHLFIRYVNNKYVLGTSFKILENSVTCDYS